MVIVFAIAKLSPLVGWYSAGHFNVIVTGGHTLGASGRHLTCLGEVKGSKERLFTAEKEKEKLNVA